MSALPSANPADVPKDAPADAPLQLQRIARFPNVRALAWDGNTLYASRGYSLLRTKSFPAQISQDHLSWESVAEFHPVFWRRISAQTKLTARLVRDGFHALTVSPSGNVIAAVSGAIITLSPKEQEFRVTHTISRGTRPLHIARVPDGTIYWGEYFDNPSREEVHIYASRDDGATWNIVHTFPCGAIRHVHNVVYDKWQNCLWILTGDYGDECRILRASCDLRNIDVLLEGNQQARAVALIPTESGLYFSSDTPLESNHIYHLDFSGKLSALAAIASSSIYGCRVGKNIFFSTMVEPSQHNQDHSVRIYGHSAARNEWPALLSWKKDRWPMGLFQYGNAFLPDGENATPYLAVTTIAVESDDMVTSLYSIRS